MIKVMEGSKLIHRVNGDNEKRNKVCQVVSFVGGVGSTGNLPFKHAGIIAPLFVLIYLSTCSTPKEIYNILDLISE